MSNNDKKFLELKNLVEGAELSLQRARKIMAEMVGDESALAESEAKKVGAIHSTKEGQVIEGIFDGQNMVGPEGKKYSVPANYASKSKLVEGDNLKLTITPDGSFVYKQINLLDRDRLIGELSIDEETNEYRVLASGKSYKVLTASITYFKGEEGDKVIILVPKGKESNWAAVENIFKQGEEPDDISTTVSEEVKQEEAQETKEVIPESTPAPEVSTPVPEVKEEVLAGDEFLSNETESVPDPAESPALSMPSAPEPSMATPQVSEPQAVPSAGPTPGVPLEDMFTKSNEPVPNQAGTVEPANNFLDNDLDERDNQGLEEI